MHSATTALLINGPCERQRHPISPGQQALEIVETFDYDQGVTKKFHAYEYEKPVPGDDSLALFVHRKSAQHFA